MNINNVIRELRQSRKLQPISVYCSHVAPSIPDNKELFDEMTPVLKLLLKAFRQASFTENVSKWGELKMFSSQLGVEVLLRIEPNTSYMTRVSLTALEKGGFDVLEVTEPRKPFVLKYFFCGTKSKWRQVQFDYSFTSVESIYAEFIQPILKFSKPFQGRLRSPLHSKMGKQLMLEENIYAFARYAKNHESNTYGLIKVYNIFEHKYVRECFVSSLGAVIFTDYWSGTLVIPWHNSDYKFLKRYIPEDFVPYFRECESVSQISAENTEHEILLEVLDRALMKKFSCIEETEQWLNEKQYSTDKKAPKHLLETTEGIAKVLTALV